MKKAQIEIVGLVIIVVLIVFIAIFALSFIIKPKPINDDILKVKANALRSSLLKTSLCGGITVKDEIENCLDGFNECMDCNQLKSEISNLLRDSLEPNEKYFVRIYNGDIEYLRYNECPDNILTSVSQILRNGNVEVGVCRR